jgi:hypothetical protein
VETKSMKNLYKDKDIEIVLKKLDKMSGTDVR